MTLFSDTRLAVVMGCEKNPDIRKLFFEMRSELELKKVYRRGLALSKSILAKQLIELPFNGRVVLSDSSGCSSSFRYSCLQRYRVANAYMVPQCGSTGDRAICGDRFWW